MPKDIAVALKYRDEEGTSSKFSEPPDIILPSQYFGVIRGCGQLTPEQKLMLAVLESAVHDFQRYHLATRRREKRIFREAHKWLTSREETGIFSFVIIMGSAVLPALGPAAGRPPERRSDDRERHVAAST